MVAVGFLPKNFGRCRNLRMTVLLENECNLSGGDTQPLLAVKKMNFLHSRPVGTQKL